MIIYLFALLISLLLTYIYMHTKGKGRKIFAILSSLPLMILSAIRYNVGTDYLGIYAAGFNEIVHRIGFRGMQFEPGFRWLNILIACFTDDYAWVFVVTSVMFGSFTFYHIYKKSSSVYLSIFLYIGMSVFFASMNGVRQMLAVSIAMFAFPFIQKKKLLQYSIIVGISMLIHTSTILFIPFYFLFQMKWNSKQIFLYTCIGIFLLFVGQRLIESVIMKLNLFERYRKYLNDDIEGGLITTFIRLVIFFVAFLSSTNNSKAKISAALGLIISIGTFLIPLFSRFLLTSDYLNMLFFPEALIGIRNKRLRILICVCCVCGFLLYVIYTRGINGGQDVVPYQTIFSR